VSNFKTVSVRNNDKKHLKEVCRVLYPRPLARYNNNKGKHWCENFCLHKVLPCWRTRFNSKVSGRYDHL